jgi:hypothetical protein
VENNLAGEHLSPTRNVLNLTQDFLSNLSHISHRMLMQPTDFSKPLCVKKGYKENIEPKLVFPDNNGVTVIEIKEMERLEFYLNEIFPNQDKENNFYCYHVVGDNLRSLPIGSVFDIQKGIFYWLPGPGFLGQFRFVLLAEDQNLGVMKKEIIIKINPRFRVKKNN